MSTKGNRDENELWEIAEAYELKWQRLIENNQELRNELRSLRGRYAGLPLRVEEVAKWVDRTPFHIRQQFRKEVEQLRKKHGIPEIWKTTFWYLAITGTPISVPFPLGFPKGGSFVQRENGSTAMQLIINDKTAMHNPIVQKFIRAMQKQFLGPPPRPHPMKDNPRKLDWQPVWEWHKAHPYVSIREIAGMLGYSYGYVRQKLAGFGG